MQTLGAAVVTRVTGEPLGGAATQRRTVALLAALAVAGEPGLSRDKLIGLFWPEVDSDRARHSLTQALYAARRALDVDDLFKVGTEIRLNDERITSDVREFETALRSGDLQQAVELYRGPFLDGFFVPDNPEFEHWSSAQRERLRTKMAGALEQIAGTFEAGGDYRSAVETRKQLVGLFPFDAAAAVNLMTALARSGDRAAALQHAQLHATLLREELGLDPDPVVEALAAKLKEPVEWIPNDNAAVTAGAVAEDLALLPQESDGGELSPDSTQPDRLSPTPTSRPVAIGVWRPVSRSRPWLRLGIVSFLAASLVGAGVLVGRGSRATIAYRDIALRQRVVVAPFRVVGAAPSLAYLRDGIVELLSTRLADDTAARSVDAGGVLAAWRATGLTSTAAVPRDTVVALAARLGAERVVLGGVVGDPARLVITAKVVSVPAGVDRGEASVSGPVDSLTALIDRLAARLLVADAGEEEQLAAYTTTSLPALRAFLAGQAAFRRNDFTRALTQYDVALRRDSSFALAALYRALAADELNDASQLQLSIALAWPGRSSLNDRDRSVLTAFSGPRYPAASTAGELSAAWRRVVDLGITSAEAWSVFGARLVHDGASAGLANSLGQAVSAYQRALALNPEYVSAWRALARLGAQSDSLADVANESGSTEAQRDAAARITPFIRWRAAIATDDTATLRRFRDSLPLLGPVTLRAIARGSQFDAIGIEDGVHALAELRQRATRMSDIAALALAEHSLAMNRGRPREALAATSRLRRALPSSHAWLRLRILDALYGDGDSTAAGAAARELTELAGPGPSRSTTSSATWISDVCVLAQWRLAHGDTAGVRESIKALASARSDIPSPFPVSPAPNACAALVDAALAVVRGLPDAGARLERIDSLVFTPQVTGDAIAYAPLLLARLHERRGDAASALRALRRRTYMSGWPRYLANTWLEEARLATQLGDTTGADLAYRQFLALRSDPEKDLVPEVEAVKALVGPLVAGSDTAIQAGR
ncbi:MAG TPA: BTAD domain-containing putative transcriptional regulator [Gemmatimonadaceae bacterium]|nr:BTAD domain-containing putative transcriptional regulator [Gemmatimonadaceae bacterium]